MKRSLLYVMVAAMSLLALLTVELLPGELGKITGKITNAKTGDPIPFAVVTIDGTTMGAKADGDGKYVIINVPPGEYSVTATIQGYQSVRAEKIVVAANTTIKCDFQLEEAVLEYEQQCVTAERDLLKANSATDVRQQSSDNIKKMLLSKSALGEVHIRGGRANEVPYVVGGVPISPAHGGNSPPNGQPVDAMFFEHYGTNPFVSTEDDHLSTFAIDVDNGSYTLARSYLNGGNLPPKDAVRVEEFINNFKYHYKHPSDEAFTIAIEGAPSKFGKEHYKLIKIGIAGKKIDASKRLDANLVFVVDVSGSMGRDERLGAVRKSLRLLLDQLNPRDRVGIVVYGSSAYTVLEPTSVNERERIINAIEQLYPSGATNAEAGIRLGYQKMDRIFDSSKINRIILCSDGVANVGQTGAEGIFAEIKRYADKGITLSAIGFGMGNYNDVLMEKLGDKGNGHYAYVDNWTEAKRVFEENLTGMLQVIARDVKIQVDFNPDVVERYRLLGYENRDVADDKFRDDKEDGGEIGSGHMVTALYEVRLKDGAKGDIGKVYVRYKDPMSFEVSETSRAISQSTLASAFHRTSTDFRLAAAAAEFAEILRESYWAKGSDLSDVLAVLRTIENEDSNEQIIELMNLVAQADKLMDDKQRLDANEPIGLIEK